MNMDGLKTVVGGHCTDTTELVSQTSSSVNAVIMNERGVRENFGIAQESQSDIIQPLKNNKKHDGVKLGAVNFPNGCVKHSVDDNGLVKLDLDTRNVIVADRSRPSAAALENCKVTVTPEKNFENSERTDLSLDNSEDCSLESYNQDSILTTKSKLTYLVESLHISENENFQCSKLDEQGQSSLQLLDVEQGIEYVVYQSELQMSDIMKLITKDLSEPYSIYTYRYFIHNWPKLCFLAMDGKKCVGSIVCKLDMHKKMIRRGYIAMLAIDQEYRRKGIGSHLVLKAIRAMVDDDCDEVVLETEITNKPALRLYENLGFVRDKRLFRYYLNGVDALRLKLWLR